MSLGGYEKLNNIVEAYTAARGIANSDAYKDAEEKTQQIAKSAYKKIQKATQGPNREMKYGKLHKGDYSGDSSVIMGGSELPEILRGYQED